MFVYLAVHAMLRRMHVPPPQHQEHLPAPQQPRVDGGGGGDAGQRLSAKVDQLVAKLVRPPDPHLLENSL